MVKFKPGNVVKVYTYGGRTFGNYYVVEGSYSELFQNRKTMENDGYKILSLYDGNSSGWWHPNRLQYVEEGSKELIKKAKDLFEASKKNIIYVNKEEE